MGPELMIANMILTGITAMSGMSAQNKMARAAEAVGEAQAQGLERQAGQERAASHRAMYREKEKAQLVRSRAQAVAGASGGYVSDVSDILGEIDREGELRAQTALYRGEEAGKAAEYAAELARQGAAGDAYAHRAKGMQMFGTGVGTILSDASTMNMYDKYAPDALGTQYDYTAYG